MDWNRVTREYLKYIAKAYTTGLTQLIIESAIDIKCSMARSQLLIITQHAIPVRNCNTIELLKAAVKIAESQGSALLVRSEVIAAVTDLHWSLYGEADHLSSLFRYTLLLALFTLLIVMFDTWGYCKPQSQEIGLVAANHQVLYDAGLYGARV
jgi:hypothetical protein